MQQTSLATRLPDNKTAATRPAPDGNVAITNLVQDNLGIVPRSTLINRNIMVSGKRTSVRLEPEMWTALLDIARRTGQTIHAIATQVANGKKPETSLTAAIRVFCLAYYRTALGG